MNSDLNVTPPTQFGLLLAQMSQVRQNLLNHLDGLDSDELDYTPNPNTIESIATILYHIAGVEYSWVFEDIFDQTMDFEEWKHAFALRSEVNIPQIANKPLQFYLDKLRTVRVNVLQNLDQFSDDDLTRTYTPGDSSVSYSLRWIIFHVIEHEQQHVGQISLLRRLYSMNQ